MFFIMKNHEHFCCFAICLFFIIKFFSISFAFHYYYFFVLNLICNHIVVESYVFLRKSHIYMYMYIGENITYKNGAHHLISMICLKWLPQKNQWTMCLYYYFTVFPIEARNQWALKKKKKRLTFNSNFSFYKICYIHASRLSGFSIATQWKSKEQYIMPSIEYQKREK